MRLLLIPLCAFIFLSCSKNKRENYTVGYFEIQELHAGDICANQIQIRRKSMAIKCYAGWSIKDLRLLLDSNFQNQDIILWVYADPLDAKDVKSLHLYDYEKILYYSESNFIREIELAFSPKKIRKLH